MNRRTKVSRWMIPLVFLLATGAFSACEDGVTAPDLPGQVVVDEVSYRVKSFAVAESFPVQVGVTVEIRNESATARSVTFPDGCVVLMRAYDTRNELVWDHGDSVACTLALVQVDLAPGATEEFQTSLVSAYAILGDELPDGEYRITAYLRPNGQRVELDAGSTDLAIPRN